MPTIRVTLADWNELLEVVGNNRSNLKSWQGPVRKIIQILTNFANLTPIFNDGEHLREQLSIPHNMNPWDLCIRLLVLNHTDFCPTLYSVTKDRQAKVDYVIPYLAEEKHEVLILKDDEQDFLELGGILKVFELKVWCLISLCLCSIPIVGAWNGFQRGGFWSKWRNLTDFVWGSLVLQGVGVDIGGKPWKKIGTGQKFRTGKYLTPLLCIWSFAGLILAQTFSGSLVSTTSLRAPYSRPFHDLRTIYESGYTFFFRPGIYDRSLTSILNKPDSSPFLRKTYTPGIGNVAQTDFHDPAKLREKLGLKKYIFPATSTYIPWRNCRLSLFQIPITRNGRVTNWPKDYFNSFGSVTIRKGFPYKANLEKAAVALLESGNMQAILQRDSKGMMLSKAVETACRERDKVRMRVIPYDGYSVSFRDEFSLFLCLWVGLAAGLVVLVMEAVRCFLFKRSGNDKIWTATRAELKKELIHFVEKESDSDVTELLVAFRRIEENKRVRC